MKEKLTQSYGTEHFGETLTKVRENEGFTRYRMAAELGVSMPCIKNWEENRHLPTVRMLAKIINFLG